MNKIRPFLKWAGNKFHCLETIISSLPPAKGRFIEPFTGSGAVFINSSYQNYLLAEQNQDLVSLFTFLQKEGPVFIDYCALLFTAENNSAAVYYRLRQQFNDCTDRRLRAALFLYLNRHGYNGLCRYNNKGSYNVPFGRYIKPYFPRAEMNHFYQKSQLARFIQSDFRQTFALAQEGDVIYCDPPYVPLTKSASFASYTSKKFNEQDQMDLAMLALDSTERGISVIISNHDTEFTRHHYQKSKIFSFPVKRFISCHAHNRLPVQELVAIFQANL